MVVVVEEEGVGEVEEGVGEVEGGMVVSCFVLASARACIFLFRERREGKREGERRGGRREGGKVGEG